MDIPEISSKFQRYIKTIPKQSLKPKNAKRSPNAFINSVFKNPNPDSLLVGLVLTRLIKYKPTWYPSSIEEALNDVYRYYPEFQRRRDYSPGFVRNQLQYEFPEDYGEESLILRVTDEEGSWISILDEQHKKPVLKAKVPRRYFPNPVVVGSQYTLVCWDLFQNWYGVDHLNQIFSGIMTKFKRKQFIKSLQEIRLLKSNNKQDSS